MNPSNPTATEILQVEQLFFNQMKRATTLKTDPVRMARAKLEARKSSHERANEHAFLSSFDYQFSDRWVTEIRSQKEHREVKA